MLSHKKSAFRGLKSLFLALFFARMVAKKIAICKVSLPLLTQQKRTMSTTTHSPTTNNSPNQSPTPYWAKGKPLRTPLQLARFHLQHHPFGEPIHTIGLVFFFQASAKNPRKSLVEASTNRAKKGLNELIR